MASASATDSSTIAVRQRWSYHAFLSFRGEDTRNNIVGHLRGSLFRKGIHTFFDDKELERGEQIAPALLKAIEGSRIAIVVFSENYASSTWCLDELSKIIECTESIGQTLIPVFYKVEPSVVRKQPPGSAFHTALQEHQVRFKDNPDKVQKWRDALHKASDLAGEHFDHGSQADFVEKIAQLVSERIGRRPLLDVAKNPVGLDIEIELVKPLLRIEEPEEVCFIGIVGMGGMGKSTLAKAIYNHFAEHFEGCGFLENVREASKQYDGLIKLQAQLLANLLKGEKIDVYNVSSGISLIKDRLQNRRCLIILDDVDHRCQTDALAGGCDWFGPGSRVIVTTRDEHVLDQGSIYRMEGLRDNDARELLSWNAFGEPSPPTDYDKVFSVVLDYAKRLPLALKVLGSMLRGRDVSLWEPTIQRLKDIPDKDIFKVLKISYDGLDEDQKAIFLYIACFFRRNKKKDDVVKMLNGCIRHSDFGIVVLMERSLITIIQGGYEDQRLDMHDLIEEMGKDIAHQEKKGLLWTLEEIRSVLEDNTGTDVIQAIYLINYEKDHIRLNPGAFKKMPMLQMLVLHGCEFSCGPSSLPKELRWLEWENYPSPSLPSNFNPRNLSGLILSDSKITELWDGHKTCPNITVIDLSRSPDLRKIPDVSGMPNLKELRADSCDSLVMVHESVGSLEKLQVLSFEKCWNLEKIPTKLRLPSLQYLSLEQCSKIKEFPDILETMEHVQTMDLSRTSIKEFPPSIENLTAGLQILILSRTGLEALPRCIYHLPNLQSLDLGSCDSLRGFMEKEEELEEDNYEANSTLETATTVSISFSGSIYPNLVELQLQENNITSLSTCLSNCYNLKVLVLSFSKHLKEIPELPPRLSYLDASDCESLETVGTQRLRSMGGIMMEFSNCYKLRQKEEFSAQWLKGHEERMKRTSFPKVEEDNAEEYSFELFIPRGDIPGRFYHGRSSIDMSLRFIVHSQSRVLKELAGFTLFAAFSKDLEYPTECEWLMNINGEQVHRVRALLLVHPDHVWIVYIHLKERWKEEKMRLVDGWNQFSFEVVVPEKSINKLKSRGVSFVGRSGENMNPSTEIKFLRSRVAINGR